MSITAAMVKELRERTGSGMMECKRNLTEANGDMELAIENMRKSGLAKADKKAGRIAAEGAIGIKASDDGKTVAMIEINSETDFVVKSEDFSGFVNAVTEALLTADVETVEQLSEVTLANGESVETTRRALIAKVGEKISVRRFEKYSNVDGGTACYLHGGKIAVIIELAKNDAELGKDIAMHIAAVNPACVSADQVSETLFKKKRIFLLHKRLRVVKNLRLLRK